jgi:hypothetical protein
VVLERETRELSSCMAMEVRERRPTDWLAGLRQQPAAAAAAEQGVVKRKGNIATYRAERGREDKRESEAVRNDFVILAL